MGKKVFDTRIKIFGQNRVTSFEKTTFQVLYLLVYYEQKKITFESKAKNFSRTSFF